MPESLLFSRATRCGASFPRIADSLQVPVSLTERSPCIPSNQATPLQTTACVLLLLPCTGRAAALLLHPEPLQFSGGRFERPVVVAAAKTPTVAAVPHPLTPPASLALALQRLYASLSPGLLGCVRKAHVFFVSKCTICQLRVLLRTADNSIPALEFAF